MNPVIRFAERNCLCYFRDRASVVFSLMAAFIVLLLYLLFLRDNLISGYPGMPGMDGLIDVWVISGLLGIVSVTTCAGALQTMVTDRVESRDDDVLVTPMSPYKVAAGYVLSTFTVGMVMSLVVLALSLVYLAATGCPLSLAGILVSVILLIPSALSGSVIMFAVTSFIRSHGAFSGFFTVVSVMIGFLTGIYMPMGTMPQAMQVVSTLMPASHMASLFRGFMADTALNDVFSGIPSSELADFRTKMGFDLSLGGFGFDAVSSLLYVTVVTVVFFLIAVYSVKRR